MRQWWQGAIAGLVSAGVALGVGELVAWMTRPAAAPVIVIGNRIVDLTPESVRLWAIRNFGTNDKTFLLTGIYVVLALAAAAVGVLAARWLWVGVVGIAAAGAFAIYSASSHAGSRASDVVPAIFGIAAAEVVLIYLLRPTTRDQQLETGLIDREPAVDHEDEDTLERRRFLISAGVLAGSAAFVGLIGRSLQHARFNIANKRAALVLPSPSGSTQPVSSADFGASGVPWATPNKDFYRVDTALTFPQIDPKKWKLRIHGMVDTETVVTYDQLLARPLIERWITLNCVSNEIGGGLIGNALWRGTLLADILKQAGVHPDADQLVMSSEDGMTIGAPTAAILDGRDALLAIAMNGEPLPIEHGFPVRVVVPGLYGYVSACKWVVDIEATTFAKTAAYWVAGGWDQAPDIKLAARIDTPKNSKKVKVGEQIVIAGVAWDQHVGVSAVQVQIEDGPWQTAELAPVPSTDTWRQWRLPWTPTAERSYLVKARAVDGAGKVQISTVAPPFPSGATGYHSILVRAS